MTSSISTYTLYIGGERVSSDSTETIDSFNPATGALEYRIPDGNAADADRAVRAAREALDSWRRLTPAERGAHLFKIADEAEKHVERLAEAETRDNGKLLRDTLATYRVLPSIWRYFAGWADKIPGSVIPTGDDALNYLRREPHGVVLSIVPWNAPLQLASHKLAAALVMGNTVVLKPSEITSGVVLDFVEVLENAGLPRGVINIVTGRGSTIGEALVSHPGVDLITFTGGTGTGTRIAKVAADRHVPCLLELGGKSPNIVFADADFEKALNGVANAIFAVSGQACTAGSRAYVHRDIYDDFVAALVERAKRIRVGDPRSDGTEMGPLAYSEHFDRVLSYVDKTVGEGARLATGGRRVAGAGFDDGLYLEPTIFDGVTPEMTITKEEIFGPVLAVIPFDTEDEVIEHANGTEFGLAAGVWTQNVNRAHRVARRIDSGVVWVNTYRVLSPITPFGGFKASGHGKEGGVESLYEYSRLKSVWMDLSE
ncbi:aldehyde dehydrogenase [Leucobacter soli]|uniref:(Z)-2-((N-methylformamido)methylene)-5-hydroxybutyrolactone dehydrogenase n=1 Tax=Leucobacter soli TaxID=2812850 RepID=A0A916JV25_9MICO|nr:aldehyde dehydrogenase [Leucobacter soli]CAG7605170.1 (Z)-2-((N-methylformamido)methylene)-5-hydroxybutyrolactone dehydrogenase [Leucobacter soli]